MLHIKTVEASAEGVRLFGTLTLGAGAVVHVRVTAQRRGEREKLLATGTLDATGLVLTEGSALTTTERALLGEAIAGALA